MKALKESCNVFMNMHSDLNIFHSDLTEMTEKFVIKLNGGSGCTYTRVLRERQREHDTEMTLEN